MGSPSALPNVARANRALSAAWNSRLLPKPLLDADHLERVALRGASAEAFGPDSEWREPLRVLVAALRDEAQLNPLGLAFTHGQIVMALRARIRAVRLWRAHPEILERPIPAPIIVLGQMRSGTTRIQRLLACDRRLAHTRFEESLIPVPRPGRRLLARAGLLMFGALNPEVQRIHPTGIALPEEEFGLYGFSFGPALFEAQWRVPSFSRWWETADRTWLYREFKALLQTGAWSRGDPPGKPMILKVPQFMQDLPAVLEAFPDARLVCLERDLGEVVASSASLVWNQTRLQSDRADRAWIGREWLRKTLLRAQVAQATRRGHPEVPQIDVAYDAVNRDWLGQIRRVYDWLGLELTPEVQRRMAAYLGGSKSHLGHRYSLADFGLSSEDIAAAPRPRPARQEA